jgi:mannose-1-phosphate guanylyltransferase
MEISGSRPTRCGVVLAGGNGKRLQSFVRRYLGYDLPKQYVNFIGSRSMLQHTYNRAERILPPERIFTVVAQEHLSHEEVKRQIERRLPSTLVNQPINKDTGPGLLLPLVHLYKQYPNATVAVFPSDHFIIQEELFCSYVKLAFEAVDKRPANIVFLGVKPTDPDPEYGYIIPQKRGLNPISSIQNIGLFFEKPDRFIAEQLMAQGALWNTMVMVFKTEILLHLVKHSAPNLYRDFQQIFRALGDCHEQHEIKRVYEQMETVNFSKDLLERIEGYSRNHLSVIPMNGVFWSDWGSEDRINSVLQQFNRLNRLQRNYEYADVHSSEVLEHSMYSSPNAPL